MEILETIFNASQSKKYNIIPAKEETKLNLKYTKEVYEDKIKKAEYKLDYFKKEFNKLMEMEDEDINFEEFNKRTKDLENKIESYETKIENYKKEILKLKEEKN